MSARCLMVKLHRMAVGNRGRFMSSLILFCFTCVTFAGCAGHHGLPSFTYAVRALAGGVVPLGVVVVAGVSVSRPPMGA